MTVSGQILWDFGEVSQNRAPREAEGEKQSSSKIFHKYLLPLSVTGGLCICNRLDEELLKPSCSDLVLPVQTLSCASKDMGLEKCTVKGEKLMPMPASWKESDMIMLDVTC